MDVTSLLSGMVGFDSVNGAISGRSAPESEISHFLESRAGSLGFQTRRLPVPGQCDNLLISLEVDPARPWLLFDSHLDTVSVQGMTVDPFGAAVCGRRLYGRGACDTKGSGAAMLTALAAYADSGDRGSNIMLLYSVDEEQGMSGIRSFVNTHIPMLGRAIRGAVVGEPTRLEPVIAHNGVHRYRVTTRGVAAHSADPSRGRSAISDMAKLILFLERDYIPSLDASYPLTGKAQCSINVIRGGSAANIIPDSCEIEVDRRTVPGESSSAIVGALKERLDRFVAAHSGARLEVETSVETPALTPRDGDGFFDAVTGALESAGRPKKGVGVPYATHAGDLCVSGIPSVVLGPGNIDQGHTKDEWIDLDELEAAVPIYLDIMRSTIE